MKVKLTPTVQNELVPYIEDGLDPVATGADASHARIVAEILVAQRTQRYADRHIMIELDKDDRQELVERIDDAIDRIANGGMLIGCAPAERMALISELRSFTAFVKNYRIGLQVPRFGWTADQIGR